VTVQDSSRPPDVRSGVADSTSLVGGLSKKEEAGSYCFVLRGFWCDRLVSSRERGLVTVPFRYGVFN
jgi:hypothetical protein